MLASEFYKQFYSGVIAMHNTYVDNASAVNKSDTDEEVLNNLLELGHQQVNRTGVQVFMHDLTKHHKKYGLTPDSEIYVLKSVPCVYSNQIGGWFCWKNLSTMLAGETPYEVRFDDKDFYAFAFHVTRPD
jgi:hypothetical protein